MDAASLAEYERAAEGIQSPDAAVRGAAEAALLSLRDSETAVATSYAILTQTASPAAQFQSLLALRAGLLRDWDPSASVDALRTQLLEFTVGRWDALEPSVRSTLLVLVALILKRAWLDEAGASARSTFFEQATQLLEAGGAQQALSCRLLLALTDEFSFGKFSNVGLAWEFHTKSRAAFQLEVPPNILNSPLSWPSR